MNLQQNKTRLIASLILGSATALASLSQAQQLAQVPSNFDKTQWVVPTENQPLINYPRTWGEYPNPCSYANFRYDDPIQKPGQFSAAPLNVFFGNSRANANSTYETLRSAGEGTCWGGPLNRSTIYMPAMMNALGKVIVPEFLDVFYRGDATTRAFPRGLKLLFGPKQMDPSYQWNVQSARYGYSYGGPGAWWGAGYEQSIYQTYSPAAEPDWAFQNSSYRQSIRAVSPDCWDGINLDSANHTSHLAYSGPDASMINACPSSHPVKIPQAVVTVYYDQINRADISGWYLSSDRFAGKNDAAGTNFYVGMIPAWDDEIQNLWVTKILNTKFYGAFGKLGDGRTLEHPPTTKLFGPTSDLGAGRKPHFLWSLFGFFWQPGGNVTIDKTRIDPPPR